MKRALVMIMALALPAVAVADSAWDDVAQWSTEDIEALLTDSPWVVEVEVYPEQVGRDTRLLPPDHPFYDPMTADVLAWQPGREPMPGISESAPARKQPQTPAADYYVRWYSARVVREALVRAGTLSETMTDAQAAELRRDDDLRYILSVSGASLERLAQLPWTAFEANVELFSSDGVRYPLLEALVNGPEVVLVFDRTDVPSVTAQTEWVQLEARFGDAVFDARFTPADMMHGDVFDIEGEPVTDPASNPHRAVEMAVLKGADRGLKRAVRRVELRENAESAPDVVIVYDPRFETGELATLDFETRTFSLATRVGAAKVDLRRVWIVNLATGQRRWLRGADAAKLTELSPGTARVFYEGVVQKGR